MNVEKERGQTVDTDSGPREAEGKGTAPIGSSGIWSEGIEDETQGSEYLDDNPVNDNDRT